MVNMKERTGGPGFLKIYVVLQNACSMNHSQFFFSFSATRVVAWLKHTLLTTETVTGYQRKKKTIHVRSKRK